MSRQEIENFWNLYEPYIRKLCTYKLSSMPFFIDDCVQEVFLALSEKLNKGESIENPKAWLTAVANNKIKDIYKLRHKESENIVALSDMVINETASENSFINIRDEEIEKIKDRVLIKLDKREREIIKCYYEDRMKIKEIAHIKKLSVSNVKQILFRAREKIKYYAKKEIDEIIL